MSLEVLNPVRSAALFVAVMLAQCAFPASVTLSLSEAKGVCKEIDLPKWPPPPEPLPPNSYDWEHLISAVPLSADLDLRASDGGVLIGLFVLPGLVKKGPPIYSPAKYQVDFAGSKGKRVAVGQWDPAQPYLVYRDSTLEGHKLRPEEKLVYKGKEFARRGTNWPVGQGLYGARLSPDGRFLSVYGWDGVNSTGDGFFFGNYKVEGHYYVDIYDVSSGAHFLSLSGRFHDVDPNEMFWASAWFSSRYYVLPLDPHWMNRLVLCDVQAAGEARQ